MAGFIGEPMSRKMTDFNRGVNFGKHIKELCSKDEMKIIRCLLGQDEHNVFAVLRFLNLDMMPNKEVRLGMWIALK